MSDSTGGVFLKMCHCTPPFADVWGKSGDEGVTFLPPDCVLVEQVIPKFPSRSEYAVKRFRPEILVNLLSDAEGFAVANAEISIDYSAS